MNNSDVKQHVNAIEKGDAEAAIPTSQNVLVPKIPESATPSSRSRGWNLPEFRLASKSPQATPVAWAFACGYSHQDLQSNVAKPATSLIADLRSTMATQ